MPENSGWVTFCAAGTLKAFQGSKRSCKGFFLANEHLHFNLHLCQSDDDISIICFRMISQPSYLDDSSEKSRRLFDICHSAIALVICMTSSLMVWHRNAQASGNT
ncbi:hypothetical protein I7I51_00099 [Histoplasma capsulatum]|uniref:Uncharacterized protein n=1 Tax=Ajellomyces capsulatus TaxID=5037 RepID=A0A8A1MEU1_AJECA|nr:hypothetical protein I7I51_00099 [Histoplasma capsulatum]